MNAPIPISRRESGERIFDARTLHEFFGVGRDFSTWLKEKIKRYGFIEGSDFITCSPDSGSLGSNKLQGRQGRIDYGLTLDMAKQLCMVVGSKIPT